MELRDIIINPIVSEKSMALITENNTYTFRVAKEANKIQIRNAIEEVFGVTVKNVNTLNVRGKKRRMGRNEGKRPDWKKAYIKLAPEDSIEVIEGL
ncbi:MAG: 50S ribosomal protein L23 [Halanaerobiaceae bacterium]